MGEMSSAGKKISNVFLEHDSFAGRNDQAKRFHDAADLFGKFGSPFMSLKLAADYALVVAVTVEITANPPGISYGIMMVQQALRTAEMFADSKVGQTVVLGLANPMVTMRRKAASIWLLT